jgi:putative sterol carrier protein
MLGTLTTSADIERLKDVDATILFDVKGGDGGLWTLDIDHGNISFEEGDTGSPDVTVESTAEDLKALISGDLKPMAAFMRGKLKVKGDMSVAMQLQKLFS